VSEAAHFGLIVLVVAGAFTAALATSKLTERFPVPGPALFLIAAAVASDLFPGVERSLSIRDVERIAVVALIVILFDGGMHVGWRRFRAAAWPISALGVIGTFATAAVMALAARYLFDFDWTTAWILGAALSPTDPAVMFSVLGNREVGGRTGTILEGESGANDPVAIALMIGILDFATHEGASVWTIVWDFATEMAVGLAIGAAGAVLLLELMRRVSLPGQGLYPIRTLAAAGVIYGVASIAHGSGFLAVFVAGLVVGDSRAPYKGEIERFHVSLASLAEIAVFVALGITIDITDVGTGGLWSDGLLLALILAFVARPLAVGPLLLPARLRPRERLFVMWGGLRGAVPILLAAFALLEQVKDAHRIYGIVFVVVAFSVVVQGTTIPFAARALGVRMRSLEPAGVQRFVVAPGSRAVGETVRALPIGERSWITAIRRDSAELPARGGTVLRAGDEVLAVTDVEDADGMRRLFERRA
jgi:potassium/hydrogen antiporter